MIKPLSAVTAVLLPVLVGFWPHFNGPQTSWENTDPGKSAPSAKNPPYQIQMQENEPPKVTILSPKDNASYPPNSRIPYKIEVSDKEDGESKYDEISSGEVLMEVIYVPASEIDDLPDPNAESPDPGLLGIAASNCLLCHAFKGNLIGPSFYEIAQKYRQTKPDPGMITNRIRNGSTGVWGDKVMPSHPELTLTEIKEMLQWITRNAAQEETQYYHGLEGTLELQGEPARKGGEFVVTSIYRDHGAKGASRKVGSDRVILKVGK